jgi:hypothetical protein
MTCHHDVIVSLYPVEGEKVPIMWVCKHCWQQFVPLDQVLEEREACAKVAENRMLWDASVKENVAHHTACKNIAADIRARGQA